VVKRIARAGALLALGVLALAIAGCADLITARLTATPDHVKPGQAVVLDASGSTGFDPETGDASHWDLDGDGLFETEGQQSLTQRAKLSKPGVYTLGVDLTSGAQPPLYLFQGITSHAFAYTDVTVAAPPGPGGNQPPSASFTYSDPQTPSSCCYTERPISFDASASGDPDGRILTYEWDWTSDGTYDVQSNTPTISHTYGSGGTYQVHLRVTDDHAATGGATRAVDVSDTLPPGADGGLTVAAARRGTPFSLLLRGNVVKPGKLIAIGKRVTQSGIVARGRTRFRRLPRALGRNRRARWAARLDVVQNGSGAGAKLSGQGVLVLAFSRRNVVCMSARAHGTPRTGASGRAVVVGGKGRGAHLAGDATIAVPTDARAIGGRLAVRHTRRAHPLRKQCGPVLRSLPR
jgi:hypothetical protein